MSLTLEERTEGLTPLSIQVAAPDEGVAILKAYERLRCFPLATRVLPVRHTYTGIEPKWNVTFYVVEEDTDDCPPPAES